MKADFILKLSIFDFDDFVCGILCGRLYLKSVNIITPKHWGAPSPTSAKIVNFQGRLNGVNLENTPLRIYKGEAYGH